MKLTEFKKLIREEIQQILNHRSLINDSHYLEKALNDNLDELRKIFGKINGDFYAYNSNGVIIAIANSENGRITVSFDPKYGRLNSKAKKYKFAGKTMYALITRKSVKKQSPLEAVAGTLDMVLDDVLPEYIERGKTITGVIPSKEYADGNSWGDSEDFKEALAYIKNNGGKIKVNTKNSTLMFTNMDITYKLKSNGDIEYTVKTPS
jgi:hypothetical protein